jgi:outer membrane protein TolC
MTQRLCLLMVFMLLSAGSSAVSARERIVLDLRQCIKRAVELSPEVAEASYEVKRLEAKRQQAEGAHYPQIEVLAITAPSPRARGDQVSSPDDSTDPVINGIFGRSEITLIQPLYTFGRLSNLREAAEGGIGATRAARERVISEIVLRTKRLYYTIQLAKSLRIHILDIKETIEEALDKVNRRLEKGLPTADEVDRYKLMTFLGIIDARLNEVEEGLAVATDALRTMTGIADDVEFDIEDEPFLPLGDSLKPLEESIRDARQRRPEFIQLREGIKAKRALVEAERSGYYPVFFMGFKGSIAGASNRDRLHNPFVFDEFNHSYASVFLGLRWTIDFGITKGRLMEAEAELNKLLEKKRYADEGIPFEVRKAYLEIEKARKDLMATESAYKNAKRWLVTALSNFDMGVGEAEDVADAIKMYALTRADYLRAVYNERLSYANLHHVTGMDIEEAME